MQIRSRFQNLLLLKKHKENSHACLPKLSYRALKTIPLLRTSLQNLPQPWLPSHPPLISVSELLASQIKWEKNKTCLHKWKARVAGAGCKASVKALWSGPEGTNASRLRKWRKECWEACTGWWEAGGLQRKAAKGEFLFLNWKVMENVTARSCSCRSMSKQPSAAVICANISRDYGSGASWERLKQRGRPDLTESLSFLTLSQQEYNHKTTIYTIPANKPARWGPMTLFCVWS